jgi:hypothetical protein
MKSLVLFVERVPPLDVSAREHDNNKDRAYSLIAIDGNSVGEPTLSALNGPQYKVTAHRLASGG